MVLPVHVGSFQLSLAVDSGAAVNVLSEESYRQLKRQARGSRYTLRPTDMNLQGVGNTPLQVIGTVNLGVRLGKDKKRLEMTFYVISKFSLPSDGLIGLRSMSEHQMEIYPPRNLVKIGRREYRAMLEPRRLLDGNMRMYKPSIAEVAVANDSLTPNPCINRLEGSNSGSPTQAVENHRDQTSPTPNTCINYPVSHERSRAEHDRLDQSMIGIISDARMTRDVTVPADMAMHVAVKVPRASPGSDLVIEGPSKVTRLGIEPTLTTVNAGGDAFALVVNQSGCDVTLRTGEVLSSVLIYNSKVQVQEETGNCCLASVSAPTSDSDASKAPTLSSHVKVLDYPDQRQTLINLLEKHRSVVALPGEALGSTTLVEHTINLKPGTRPVYIPAYRLPHSQRSEVEKQVAEMLEQGVITESNSEWNSPLFLVPKRDGTFRPVIDFRKVNMVTEDDRHPLPVLRDILTSLGKGNVVFSTIDLLSGYWQVPLSQESQKITAFSTPNGHYHYLKMAFGLKGAPITFARMMSQLFSGMIGKNMFVFLDDIIIYNRSVEEHFQTLEEVFARLEKANLKAKMTKCVFLKRSVSFLGHRVDAEGIHTADDKIRSVKEFPQPKSVENVRSFLGLCGYYRSFVRNFASIASPLNMLLKKDRPFHWGGPQEQSFQRLKEALTTAPVLTFPDFSRPFCIYTDASALGLGAVLMQAEDDGKNKVIAYASRTLNQAEGNYSVTHQEALAIVWALKTFKDIVFGYPITVFTDHSAVTHLFEGRKLSGRLARWDLTIQEFNPVIKYVPGKANRVADSLSRNPVSAIINDGPVIDNFSIEELRSKQRASKLWQQVIYCLESGDSVPIDELRVPLTQFLINQDGVLCRYWQEKRYSSVQFVIPEELVPVVLKLEHDTPVAGHPGKERTLEAMRRKYYWPSMKVDIDKHIDQCKQCALNKGSVGKPAPILEFPPPSYPMEVIGIDLLSLSPSHQGSRYLLVCVDHLTRYVMLAPLKDKTAESVAHALVTQVFLKHGTPRVILSDNGAEFRNSLLSEICTQFNVRQAFITAYHPASNGLVERSNRKILDVLRPVVGRLSEMWEDWLPYITASINAHVCSSTGQTPHYSLYRQELRLPYDLLGRSHPPVYNSQEFGEAQLKVFSDLYSDIRDRLQENKAKMAEKQHKYAAPIILDVGDVVMVQESDRTNKLHPRFSGPYIITSRAYGNAFELLDPDKRTLQIVHNDRLKKTNLDVGMTLDEAKDIAYNILMQCKHTTPQTTTPTHQYNLRSRSRVQA